MKQVRPKKNLGQHFLTDLNIAKAIADTVDACPDLPVLEVGPGMGVMTQYLVEKPRPFKVVEIDRESVAYLQEHFPEFTRSEERGTRSEERGMRNEEGGTRNEEGGTRKEDTLTTEFRRKGNLVPRSCVPSVASDQRSSASFLLPREIISADFLRMDLREVFDGQQFVLTGNYPYDISSQIFFKMLDNKDLIPCCTGMIQHEVALRMASQPGNKQYGILSVLIQAWYHVEYLFTVEPGVFNPPPKVQSAVIRMTRNEVTDLGCDETLFRRVVKTTFNQRRKMLRVSLRQLFNGAQTASPHFFEDPMMTRRPEQLSIQEFVELTNKVEKELFSDTI